MKKRIFAVVMAAAMVLSLAACGEKQTSTDTTPTPTTAPTATTAPTEAPADPTPTEVPAPQNVTIANASVTFEDGNMGFVKAYMQHATSADVELSIADYNGSKALKVVNKNGKAPWVAFDLASILGADVSKVAKVDMVIGTTADDGKFYAVSGEVITWWGAELTETKMADWSVYLEKKNPRVISTAIKAGNEFVADASNIMMVSLRTDNGLTETGVPGTFYIDDICFYDAAGNILKADTSVAFVNPEGFEKTGLDANLLYVDNAVNLDGFAVNAGGWAQAGIELTDEQRALLVPGSVIEISYNCSEPVWMVAIGENPLGGWLRGIDQNTFVPDGYVSTDGTTIQYTYEQLAKYWGEDFGQYVGTLQCEGKADWEVYSVKIGTVSNYAHLGAATNLDGFAVSAGGWAQAGIDLTDEQRALLKPGSIIEISYNCASPVWMVAIGENPLGGWLRGVDQSTFIVDGAVSEDGTKVQYTYEQLAKYWGDGFEQYLTTLQCEGQADWEVYSVKIAKPMKPATNVTTLDGFTVSAGGWAQAGIDLTDEQRALFVPGCVVNIQYNCAAPVWMVAIGENPLGGWLRGVDQNTFIVDGAVSEDGTTVQYTYEQLAKYWGEDFGQYLTTLQCEGNADWEVYGVTVGKAGVAAEAPAPTETPVEPATPAIPDPVITAADGKGSVVAADASWWTQIALTKDQLFAGVAQENITGFKFTSDTEFIIAYNNAEAAWVDTQNSKATEYNLAVTDINYADDIYAFAVILSKGDSVEYTINWEVLTAGGAAEEPKVEEPAADALVINFKDLTTGGYGYEATVNGDAVDVSIASQYQELQYVLAEAIDLAAYKTLVIDVTSNAQLDIKLVNPEAAVNEYSQKTPFLDNYTAEGAAITSPITIDLAAYADYDLSQINFMAMGDGTTFTIKSMTFTK